MVLNISTTGIITILIGIVWIAIARYYKDKDYILTPGLSFGGLGSLGLFYKTENGKGAIDRFAKKFSRPLSILGIIGSGFTYLLSLFVVVFLLGSALQFLRNPSASTATSPTNYLIVPGVNDFLPLSVAVEIVLGLAFAMIIHEGGHAVYCRLADIDIDSMGLFFLVLPLGAFVEPKEEEQLQASIRERIPMFAAGITGNIILTIGAIIGLILIGLTISPAVGVPVSGVYENTPAYDSGLEEGDMIIGVNGESVTSPRELQAALSSSGKAVSFQTKSGEEHTVTRELTVLGVTQNTLSSQFLNPGSKITQVNGKTVYTLGQFREAATTEDEMVSVTLSDGYKTSVPIGAATTLSDGSTVVITSINGQRVHTGEDLRDIKSDMSTAEVAYYDKTERVKTTLSTDDISTIHSGYSGVEFTDVGVSLYPSSLYYSLINPIETSTSMMQWTLLFFFAPFGSLVGLSASFYGLAGPAASFFSGNLITFFIFNVLFWTAWININLAIFNAIPITGLDGGYLMQDMYEAIGAKLGASRGTRHIAKRATSISMLLVLLTVFIGPFILG